MTHAVQCKVTNITFLLIINTVFYIFFIIFLIISHGLHQQVVLAMEFNLQTPI